VFVTLDPVPGTFSTPESAKNVVRGILEDRLPESYNPVVIEPPIDIRELANALISEGTN
jgi:hypothetical protein